MILYIIPSVPNFLTYLTVYDELPEHEFYLCPTLDIDLKYFNIHARRRSIRTIIYKRYEKIIFTDAVFLGKLFNFYLLRKYIYSDQLEFNLFFQTSKEITASKYRRLQFKQVKRYPHLLLLKEFVSYEYKKTLYPGIKLDRLAKYTICKIDKIIHNDIVNKDLINEQLLTLLKKEKYSNSVLHIVLDNKYSVEEQEKFKQIAAGVTDHKSNLLIKPHPYKQFNSLSKFKEFRRIDMPIPIEVLKVVSNVPVKVLSVNDA